MSKKYVIVFFFMLFVLKGVAQQQAYIFSTRTSKISYQGLLIKNPIDDNSRTDTAKFSFVTELENIYSSNNLKIIKCKNFPLFIEFDKSRILRGQFNTYFLVISDSQYCVMNYKDIDVNEKLKILLNRKDKKSESNFLKLPHYTLLNTQNSNEVLYRYEEGKDNYLQMTKKLNKYLYETILKDNNSEASYFLDYKIGLFKINYHWERISDYEVIIKSIF